jgi:hypothetical protein
MGRALKVDPQNIGMPKKKDPDPVNADVFDFGQVDGVTSLDFLMKLIVYIVSVATIAKRPISGKCLIIQRISGT